MNNSPPGKIILDLCGGSGNWSRPYRDAGFKVIVVDKPDYDVFTFKPPTGVFGILAAPPCTEFSLAVNFCGRKRDLKGGMLIVQACLDIIHHCLYRGYTDISQKLNFWALENPVGLLRRFLGIPAYTFHPHHFGDWISKNTDVFGHFRPPRRTDWVSAQHSLKITDFVSGHRPDIRSITPPAFSEAFFRWNH